MDMTRQLSRAAAVTASSAVLALAMTACGGDDGPADLPALEKGGTALKPGDYKTTKFTPRAKFKVGTGWETASTEVTDYFDLVRVGKPFKALAFERITRVTPPKTSVGARPAPPDLVSYIREHPKLSAGKPGKTTVAGLPATEIEARVKSAVPRNRRPTSCDKPCLPLFLPSDRRPVSYELGDRLRFLILKSGGEQITITIAAAAADFKRFLPQAEKVVSSVKLGD